MTRGGDNVSLPYDLRVPYARLLARWVETHLSSLKTRMPLSRLGTEQQRRYNIGRVLREKKVFGLHPKECVECAFDIAGPASGSVLADAEVSWSWHRQSPVSYPSPLFSTCSLSSISSTSFISSLSFLSFLSSSRCSW